MKRVHAIVMTGNDENGFINGVPKCYVDLPDISDIKKPNPASLVLSSLNMAKRVQSITVIGDEECLESKLKVYSREIKKPIIKVYQKEEASFADNLYLSHDVLCKRLNLDEDTGVLYVSGDAPFRRHVTIDDFIEQIKDGSDVAMCLIEKEYLKQFLHVFRKPLLPISKNGKLKWCKPDDMVFIKPKKIPRNIIETLYQRRRTDKVRWSYGVLKLFLEEYPKLFPTLAVGVILRQFKRSTNITLPLFNGSLDIAKIEKIAREYPPNLNGQIITTRYADGYLDIDNEADYRKIHSNFSRLKYELVKL